MSGTGARGRECWLLKLIWKLLRLPCEHARLDEPLSNFLRFSLPGEAISVGMVNRSVVVAVAVAVVYILDKKIL